MFIKSSPILCVYVCTQGFWVSCDEWSMPLKSPYRGSERCLSQDESCSQKICTSQTLTIPHKFLPHNTNQQCAKVGCN